jgi:hypothetical protein
MSDINYNLVSLKAYLDKSFISAILCNKHYEFYYNLNLLLMFPMVIGSSFLTILNSSSIEDDKLKIVNISINGTNTLMISVLTFLKISERISVFKNGYNKFNKLSHRIESLINKQPDNINIEEIINEYDKIQDDITYTYMGYYKKKVIKKYGKTKSMPNSLQLDQEITNSDLVITNIV